MGRMDMTGREGPMGMFCRFYLCILIMNPIPNPLTPLILHFRYGYARDAQILIFFA